MLLLLFRMGNERYALDTQPVESIVPVVDLRSMAGTPKAVAGFFSYRQQIVPVIDLSYLTLKCDSKRLFSSRIILVRYPTISGHFSLLGLLAENATETVDIKQEQLKDAGVFASDAPHLGPFFQHGQEMVQCVTLQNLLPVELQKILFQQPNLP